MYDRRPYMKKYRDKNREKLRRQRRNWNLEYGGKNKAAWNSFLKISRLDQCSICGYNRCIAALEFHHMDPESKKFNIGNITRRPFTPENVIELLEEIDKCVILCANCHREFHYATEEEQIEINNEG